MTTPTVRDVRWSFGPETPFQWNPANPVFGLSMNTLTFIAPPFERYIVLAVRDAMRVIDDPAVLREADAFLRQEALHARAHRLHVAALVAQYPALAELSQELERRYDALLAAEPLAFHLAYVADIEATFTPLFSLFLRHKPTLFDNGDHRVAPLFLWHFVEEMEHRCSAQIVYDAVVRDPWYRLRLARRVFAHMLGLASACAAAFNRHVPPGVRLARVEEHLAPSAIVRRLWQTPDPAEAAPDPFAAATWREKATLVYRLLRSQYPRHSQADEPVAPFAAEWFAAYAAGRDVARWYDA